MVQTCRVFIIGPEMQGYVEALEGRGWCVKAYKTAIRAAKDMPRADIMIIRAGWRDHQGSLAKAARGIPKVIVSSAAEDDKKGLGVWIKEPYAYPLYDPTGPELASFTIRLLESESKVRQDLLHENHILKTEIELFEKMNSTLTSAREISDVLNIVLQSTKALTGAAACCIYTVESDGNDIYLDRMTDAQSGLGRRVPLDRQRPGIAGQVALSGKPALLSDASSDEGYVKGIDGVRNIKPGSLMSAPILSHGETIGVLQAFSGHKQPVFTERDLKHLRRFSDQAALAVERIRMRMKLEEQAITDDLTNLFNVRYLNRSIETEVARSKRYSTSVSLIFLDLDHFKDVNDNYGHLIGSKLLVELSQILLGQLRSIDIVVRYGGDEFVVILPQTILNNAMIIAERIRKAVEHNVFLRTEGLELKITSSFGVAAYPESAKSKEELLRLADEAMYRVKNRTRNGVYAII